MESQLKPNISTIRNKKLRFGYPMSLGSFGFKYLLSSVSYKLPVMEYSIIWRKKKSTKKHCYMFQKLKETRHNTYTVSTEYILSKFGIISIVKKKQGCWKALMTVRSMLHPCHIQCHDSKHRHTTLLKCTDLIGVFQVLFLWCKVSNSLR